MRVPLANNRDGAITISSHIRCIRAVPFLQNWVVTMRALLVALIGVVLFSSVIVNPENKVPSVSADTVSIKRVRADASGRLIVERPIDAREDAPLGVFVVTDDGVLRRAPVQFGRASSSLIEIVSGLSAGDRIIVSDMRAWDQFDRLRLRSR